MKAFIFDFDGVIVDSELHWDAPLFAYISSIAPGWTMEKQRNLQGMSMHHIVEYLNETEKLSLTVGDVLASMESRIHLVYEQCNLLPGIPALIERLQQQTIPIGIASSSQRRWIDSALRRFGMQDTFPVISSADEMPERAKPFPDLYLLTAKRLGVEPASCVAIEDSKNGSTAAKEAGMVCIGLRTSMSEHQDLSRCDRIIHHLDELTADVLQSL